MPRFDLYAGREGAAYLLDVQADHLDHLPTRVVVPLTGSGKVLPPFRDITPILTVEDRPVVMMTPLLASIPRRLLGRLAGNLRDQADAITRALNLLLTGF